MVMTWSSTTSVSAKRRSEEHTSELQSPCNLVCRLLLEKKKQIQYTSTLHNVPGATLTLRVHFAFSLHDLPVFRVRYAADDAMLHSYSLLCYAAPHHEPI